MRLPHAYREMVSLADAELQNAKLGGIRNVEDLRRRISQPPKSTRHFREGLKAVGIVARAVAGYLYDHPGEEFRTISEGVRRFQRQWGHLPQVQLKAGSERFSVWMNCVSRGRAIARWLDHVLGEGNQVAVAMAPYHVAKVLHWGGEALVVDPVFGKPMPTEEYKQALIRAARNYRSPYHSLAQSTRLVGHTRLEDHVGQQVRIVGNEAIQSCEYNSVGIAHSTNNREKTALVWYRKAARTNPEDHHPVNNIGTAYYKLGRLGQAERYVAKAVGMVPTDSFIHANLATVYARRKKFDQAMHHAREALKLNPEETHAHEAMGHVLGAQGKTKSAIDAFEKALFWDQDNYGAHNGLAEQCLKQGRWARAIDHLQCATDLNAKYDEAYHNLGIAYAKAGQLDEAQRAFQTAARLNPTRKATKTRLKKIRSKNKRPQTA